MAVRSQYRILFLRPVFAIGSSFVKVDLELLGRHFVVTPMAVSLTDKLAPLRVAKAVVEHDLCYIWFCDLHAYWATLSTSLFGKPSVVVAGGYDAVSLPEIGYGLACEDSRRWALAKTAYRRSSRVLAFSKSSMKSIAQAIGNRDNLDFAHMGFDASIFRGGEKSQQVLTVCHVNSSNLLRKGLITFATASRFLEDVPFIVAGNHDATTAAQLSEQGGANLHLLGRLSDTQLQSVYRNAKVYCQLSAHEGFGCALAEAMLSECIPVVTNRGSLPEVVGDLGYCVEYGDAEGTAQAIRQALQADHGKQCRERIMEQFPMEKREAKLVEVIEELLRRK
jgi:glycosyltransferase involved in cell wall biosynthesis